MPVSPDAAAGTVDWRVPPHKWPPAATPPASSTHGCMLSFSLSCAPAGRAAHLIGGLGGGGGGEGGLGGGGGDGGGLGGDGGGGLGCGMLPAASTALGTMASRMANRASLSAPFPRHWRAGIRAMLVLRWPKAMAPAPGSTGVATLGMGDLTNHHNILVLHLQPLISSA